MDSRYGVLLRIVATVFLIFAICGNGVLASASATVALPVSLGGGSGMTYRMIGDRQDALGNHPVLMENPGAHDPSYKELMDFLKTDDTVKNKYDNPNFTCADFATELQHHAESKGINCGYASFGFVGKDSGHAVDIFDTTDRGTVYVDTTGGKTIVTEGLTPGDTYYNLGVIAKITEYW